MNAILYQAVVFNLQPFKSLVPQLEWGKKQRHDMEKVLQYSTIQVSHLIVQFRMGKLRNYANFMPGTLTLQASHNTSSLPLHAELAWRNVPETYGAQNRSRTHHQYETWFCEAVKPCDRANHECNLKPWVNFDIFLQIRRNLEFAPSKLRNWSDVTIVSS